MRALPLAKLSPRPMIGMIAEVGIALACVLATFAILFEFCTQAAAQRPVPSVTIAQPAAKQIVQWDEFAGRFEAIKNVEVRPRVSGFIDKVHFKDGQIVKTGDPLFTIDPRPFEIAVATAEAEIARANADVKLQENEVERARPLLKSRAVSVRDFEQRRAKLGIAKAALQSAKSKVRSAKLDLEWTTVRAPIDGRISDKKVDQGALVTGGAMNTTLLTTIVSINPIHFIFEGSESDYLRYLRASAEGSRPSSRDTSNPVRIKLADETEWKRTGKMDFVDNRLDPRTGTIRGRALVENNDRLLTPGLFGRLQLFGGKIDALLVPDAAIVSDQTKKIVMTVNKDNIVVPKPVELGDIAFGLRIIKSGLQKTDQVIIKGIANPFVRPGVKVKPDAGTIALVKPDNKKSN
ncbi:MAG: efflux RND transporter periplasmic adaptor subunit [Hyphomicrobiaceae bacterium]